MTEEKKDEVREALDKRIVELEARIAKIDKMTAAQAEGAAAYPAPATPEQEIQKKCIEAYGELSTFAPQKTI